MTMKPPSELDRTSLANAYASLLSSRQSMIEKLRSVEDSLFRRTVLIDALIAGLIAHFHEVSRNQSAYAEEIKFMGGNLSGYIASFTDELPAVLNQLALPTQQPPSGQGPSSGRTPGKRSA